MEVIHSITIDHTKLKPGIYVSRSMKIMFHTLKTIKYETKSL